MDFDRYNLEIALCVKDSASWGPFSQSADFGKLSILCYFAFLLQTLRNTLLPFFKISDISSKKESTPMFQAHWKVRTYFLQMFTSIINCLIPLIRLSMNVLHFFFLASALKIFSTFYCRRVNWNLSALLRQFGINFLLPAYLLLLQFFFRTSSSVLAYSLSWAASKMTAKSRISTSTGYTIQAEWKFVGFVIK